MGPVQRNTRSRGGGSVSSALHTYPGLVSVSPGCFQRCFPFPQLGLFPKQLVDPSLHGLQLECSSNVSSPALKGRHKSAIKASNSETIVNVCVNRVLAVLAGPALAMLTGYKLIADSGNQNKTCDNKAL